MKLLFTLFILLTGFTVLAQTAPKPQAAAPKANIPHTANKASVKDTVMEKDTSKENKEPRYFYVTASTNIFVNTKGGVARRFSPAFEFGRTYGIFDVGIATGMVNSLSSGNDTTHYIEFRPTINVFSKGRFSESLCLGMGAVFNANQGLMTEVCNSINFSISENWEVAVSQAYCYFDGTNSSRNTQYMGFNVTYNFLRKHSTNIRRKKEAIVSDN